MAKEPKHVGTEDVKLGGISLGQGAVATIFVLLIVVGIPVFNSYLKANEARKKEQEKVTIETEEKTERTVLVHAHDKDIVALKISNKAHDLWITEQSKAATRRAEGHNIRDARLATLSNADHSKEVTLNAIRDWIIRQDPDAVIPPVVYEVVHAESFNGTASD